VDNAGLGSVLKTGNAPFATVLVWLARLNFELMPYCAIGTMGNILNHALLLVGNLLILREKLKEIDPKMFATVPI